MSISEPFIRRPIATSLLMLGVLVFGIGAYNLLPVAAVPNVDFPTITVTAQYPGASPSTMASAVATPLEQQFISIPSLAEMTSWSGVGVSSITLQFDLSRNIDAAAGDVQQAINAASGLLPKDMPTPPTYRKVNPANFAILIYAIHSDALPPYRVDDYANNVIADRLSTEPGVGQVFVFGSMPYAARVQINPAALAAKGLGLEDVRNALVARDRQRAERRDRGRTSGDCARYQRSAVQRRAIRQHHHRLQERRAGARSRMSATSSTRCRTSGSARGSATSGPRASRSRRPREPTRSTWWTGSGVDAEARAVAAAIGPCRPDVDRSQTIRAAVRDVQFTMLLTIGSRRRRDLPVFANVVGDGDPEPGGAAVAARHLRRHVCRRLQHRQHLADGR